MNDASQRAEVRSIPDANTCAIEPPPRHLQRVTHRTFGLYGGERFGLKVDDLPDSAVRGDIRQRKRDEGVLHPEGELLVLIENEEHALPVRQAFPEHETSFSLDLGPRDLGV